MDSTKQQHTKNEVFGKRPGMTAAEYETLKREGRIEHEGRTYLLTDLIYEERSDGRRDVCWFGILAEQLPVLIV